MWRSKPARTHSGRVIRADDAPRVRYAQERSRTSKPVRALVPETSVFAISPPGPTLRGHYTASGILSQRVVVCVAEM